MKTWLRNAVLKSGLTPHNPSETNPALALFNLNKAVNYCNHYKAYINQLITSTPYEKTRNVSHPHAQRLG